MIIMTKERCPKCDSKLFRTRELSFRCIICGLEGRTIDEMIQRQRLIRNFMGEEKRVPRKFREIN